MPIYMIFWSIVLILILHVWRLQNWQQTAVVTAVTAVILFFSQALFAQLAVSAGVAPHMALTAPEQFLRAGIAAWLALLVMPCGWLGPLIGMNLVQRRA